MGDGVLKLVGHDPKVTAREEWGGRQRRRGQGTRWVTWHAADTVAASAGVPGSSSDVPWVRLTSRAWVGTIPGRYCAFRRR